MNNWPFGLNFCFTLLIAARLVPSNSERSSKSIEENQSYVNKITETFKFKIQNRYPSRSRVKLVFAFGQEIGLGNI